MGSEDHAVLPTKTIANGTVRYSGAAYLACVVLMLQNCMSLLVIRYSREQSGPAYIMSWTVVLTEVVKVAVCLVLSLRERFSNPDLYGCSSPPRSVLHALQDVAVKVFDRSFLYISVPGVLYAAQNNLLFFALSHLQAVVFSLLSQFKIVTTAFFSVLILGRRLSAVQWFSLALLLSGICFVQYDSMANSHSAKDPTQDPHYPRNVAPSLDSQHQHDPQLPHHASSKHEPENSLVGFLAVFLLTITSAVAGVYFEKIVKGMASGPTSMWVSNIQLGIFGVVSSCLVLYSKDWDVFTANPLFHGFNWVVLAAILLHSFGGLITATVVKYADNILKSFATSFSMVLASIISWFFIGIPLSYVFLAGSVQVIIATHLYSTNPSQ